MPERRHASLVWMSLVTSVQRFVSPSIRSRGTELFHLEAVRDLALSTPERLRATVRGGEDYVVSIIVRSRVLAYRCNCLYFDRTEEICKHVWAVILEADRKKLLNGGVPVSRVTTIEAAARGAGQVHASAAERTQPRAVAPSVKPPWLKLLESLTTPAPRRGVTRLERKLPDELLYVMMPPVSNTIQIEIQGRTRKRSGEWSSLRPWPLEAAQLDQLPEVDREMVSLLSSGVGSFANEISARQTIRPAAAPYLLSLLADTGRFHLFGEDGPIGPLQWDSGEPWQFSLEVQRNEDGDYQLTGTISREGESLPFTAVRHAVGGIIFTDDAVARLQALSGTEWIPALARNPVVEIPAAEADQFVEALMKRQLPPITLPDELQWSVREAEPEPLLRLERSDGYGEAFSGEVWYGYDDLLVSSRTEGSQVVRGKTVYRRDLAKETKFSKRLDELGIMRDYYGRLVVRGMQAEGILSALVGEGWRVELGDRMIHNAKNLTAEITTSIDWFDLNGGVDFGGLHVSLPELLEALRKKRSWIELSDGSLGILPKEWLTGFEPVIDLGRVAEDGSLRFNSVQALLVDSLIDSTTVVPDSSFVQLRQTLKSAAAPLPAEEPEEFIGELRPYQREGLGWLQWLESLGIGGCLADDMGLGKTVQLLALLAGSRTAGTPSLVVAPRSLLFNWREEAARFAPALRLLEYHGSERSLTKDDFSSYDLILTTYGVVRSDISSLSHLEFDRIILDEAQTIKNSTSQTSRAVRLLRGRMRLALSGTPVENHLSDLWSIFEFLNPGMLGSARSFSRSFAQRNVPKEKRELLGRAIRPFLLRRTKEQVAPELPRRSEQTLYCELDTRQRKKYDELRDHYRATLLSSVRERGMARSKMHVLEALLRLRQAACHPGLISGKENEPSAKLDLFMEEIELMLDGGHKALVFSQFTSMLRLVGRRLMESKISFSYLDGKTKDRQEMVDRFQQSDGPPLFLISLKAGGVGLNLTEADYVFLLDPWWNPAAEAQAIDRSHRIGQDKPVIAYRLIARDTIEEKIVSLQQTKRALADSIMSEDNSMLQGLELADLEMLLS
jgi:superfamily II DNA or RNA helicase